MMMMTLLAGALAIGSPQQQMDTTFAVRRGGELHLDALNGTVTVGTWDRSSMRVRATHRGTTRIDLDHTDSMVDIETDPRGERPDAVTFEITVPDSYNVYVEGVNLSASVAGVRGDVSIENVQGPITVRDVTGTLDIESVSGGITIENVRGDLDISTVNEAVRISGTRGSIIAETVNGSITMRGVDAGEVEASTVNGIVEYDGTVRDGGHYFLATHNGAITMTIPEQANARIAVETENGRVQSVFPVRVTGGGDRSFNFSLGSGSASIELESFNGTINLVRPRGR